MRKELADAALPERIDPTLTRLIAAWDTGDGIARRQLLATLFLDILVRESRAYEACPFDTVRLPSASFERQAARHCGR
ncbi:MAG TPA: hypothetical protein VFD88_03060 [Clostridia bacterium]|nr:hypothetical protein [Clostridia bacterium]